LRWKAQRNGGVPLKLIKKKKSRENKITQTTLEEPETETAQHGKTRKRANVCVETCLSVWIRSSLTNTGKVTKSYSL